ncbi:ArnT family glycosyltransferase [Actinomadura opuntiae]|uniref:ArnT family glycosyltransferase n=1 Tax=Actinomadura sp. OS1-43 TaxID=604315 RepID=UPI00255A7A94|nr:glycosyltransferase family 39 protein [Actinomadura sp. OS1-43]MDL4820251.1 glycosyltransferase family 39 protein [Actinomadura sp. OS1-43]
MRTEPADHGESVRAAAPEAEPRSRGAGVLSWWWAGMAACLAIATVLRVWHTAADAGNGNAYYTATALSMSKDWTSFLSGSLDTGHFITMDKPAPALWPSAILIDVFGVHWATIFLPTALAGVASVLVLGLAVREAGAGSPAARAAALLAALALAISPVNVAVERDNNPDALLLLTMLTGAWLLLRALRRDRTRPLLGAAAVIGLGFDVKYLEAFVVVPALALVWLLFAAGPVRRRVVRLAAAAVPLVAVSAAWPLVFRLLPHRPWVGNSKDGTVEDRIGQIFSDHLSAPGTDVKGPGAVIIHAFQTGQAFHAGESGPGRLLSGVLADQISWWLPLAVVGAATMAYDLRRRRDASPAGLVLWTGWAVCCWAVFSFMQGVLHPYYTSLMAPALAALAAGGLVSAWTAWRRGRAYGAVALAAQIAVAGGWSAWVLHDTSAHRPGWLPPLVLAAAALALLAVPLSRPLAWAGGALAVLTAVTTLAAPAVWSAKTTDQRLLGINPLANQDGRYGLAVVPPQIGNAIMGVISGSQRVDPGLLGFLQANQGSARWLVAVPSGLQSAPMEIAAGGAPIMAMGGFDGSNPTPTLAQFRRLVARGEIRFILTAPPGRGFTGFGSGPSIQVSLWALKACRMVRPTATGLLLLDCQGAGAR